GHLVKPAPAPSPRPFVGPLPRPLVTPVKTTVTPAPKTTAVPVTNPTVRKFGTPTGKTDVRTTPAAKAVTAAPTAVVRPAVPARALPTQPLPRFVPNRNLIPTTPASFVLNPTPVLYYAPVYVPYYAPFDPFGLYINPFLLGATPAQL